MSINPNYPPGSILWADLTVPIARNLVMFYSQVAGWSAEPVPMGTYEDYNMIPHGQTAPVAGICHAVGVNAGIPPVWMIYIVVSNLEASMKRVTELGGTILRPPNFEAGNPSGRFCVIQDPAGAVLALFEPPTGPKD